jgi:hypothetical protein
VREQRPERLCHLVHSIPAEADLDSVVLRAGAAGAAVVGASRGLMPNPWDRFEFDSRPSDKTVVAATDRRRKRWWPKVRTTRQIST